MISYINPKYCIILNYKLCLPQFTTFYRKYSEGVKTILGEIKVHWSKVAKLLKLQPELTRQLYKKKNVWQDG